MAEADTPPALREKLLDVEFVEGPQEDWECPVCKLTLLDPALLSCCGNHLCQACVGRLRAHPCPLCNEQFTALLDKRRQRFVHQATVHCPNRENGCEWRGELRLLLTHLSDRPDGDSPRRTPLCQYERVSCPNEGCGEQILRINLQEHQTNECLYRRLVCQHCTKVEATYKELSEVHWLECPDFPVPCPNDCGVEEMRRSEVQSHCDRDCKGQVIRCPFWDVGCSIKRPRKNLPAHTKASDEHHSQLLVKKMVEMQSKLVEQDIFIKSLNEEIERKTVAMEVQLQERDDAIQRLSEEAKQQDAEFKKYAEDVDARFASLKEEFDVNLKERDEKIKALVKENIKGSDEQMKTLADGFEEKLKENGEKIAAVSARFERELKERDVKLEAATEAFDRKVNDEVSEAVEQIEKNHRTEFDKLADELAQVVTTTATIQTALGMEEEENRLHQLDREIGTLRQDCGRLIQEMKTDVEQDLATVKKELVPRVEHKTTVDTLKKEVIAQFEKQTNDKLEKGFAQMRKEATAQHEEQRDEWRKRQATVEKLAREVAGSKEETRALTEKVSKVEDVQKNQVQGVSVADVAAMLQGVKMDLETKVAAVKEDVDYVEKTVTPTPRFSFTVSRFTKRREKKESFVSDPFYTSHRGYRMIVRVDSAGTDTHVSVWCCITRGQHDHLLPWPLRADIVVRLVNQKDDTKHYERQISYDKQALKKHAGRVITGDKNYLWGLREFITMKEVLNGQYLVGDALDFVVLSVELKEMDRPVG